MDDLELSPIVNKQEKDTNFPHKNNVFLSNKKSI